MFNVPLYKNILNNNEEYELVEFIEQQPWDKSMARHVQHYGFRYKYKFVKGGDEPVPPVPDLFLKYLDRIRAEYSQRDSGTFDYNESNLQVIVNKYQPNQGISPHIDDMAQFGPTIICLCLNSDGIMVFRHRLGGIKQVECPRASVYIMSGIARTMWTHSYHNNGNFIRYSITFRTMNKN